MFVEESCLRCGEIVRFKVPNDVDGFAEHIRKSVER